MNKARIINLRITALVVGILSSLTLFTVLAQTPNTALASVTWSPDGTMVAGGGKDILRVWNASTGATIVNLQGISPGHVNLSVSWSPDSKKLVTATDDLLVRVWNIADPNYSVGQLLGTLTPANQGSFLWSAVWSPNGQSIATGLTSDGYTLKIWNANNFSMTDQFASGWSRKLS